MSPCAAVVGKGGRGSCRFPRTGSKVLQPQWCPSPCQQKMSLSRQSVSRKFAKVSFIQHWFFCFGELHNWSVRTCLVGVLCKDDMNCVYVQLIISSWSCADLIDPILKPDTSSVNTTVCILHSQVWGKRGKGVTDCALEMPSPCVQTTAYVCIHASPMPQKLFGFRDNTPAIILVRAVKILP